LKEVCSWEAPSAAIVNRLSERLAKIAHKMAEIAGILEEQSGVAR